MKFSKEGRRVRIHYRIRKKVLGTAARPRFCVYRSNREIYCQIIDDVAGHTLAAASSREATITREGNKSSIATAVGKLAAERALAKNIDKVVFDRGGYLYHGRVKALADGAREAGLNF